MMPGAPDRLAHEDPLGEGTTVVRALRPDREAASSDTREDDGVVTDLAGENGPLGKIVRSDAGAEVGSGGGFVLVGHARYSRYALRSDE